MRYSFELKHEIYMNNWSHYDSLINFSENNKHVAMATTTIEQLWNTNIFVCHDVIFDNNLLSMILKIGPFSPVIASTPLVDLEIYEF